MRERIEHILESIDWIEKRVCIVSLQEYASNADLQLMTQFQFLIIGEAIRTIDQDILEKYAYPWHVPRSFRNYIAHTYHKIIHKRVYDAANDLTDLKVV